MSHIFSKPMFEVDRVAGFARLLLVLAGIITAVPSPFCLGQTPAKQESPTARSTSKNNECAPATSTQVKPIQRRKEVVPVDWTTLTSTYTHDTNGNRVDQYSEGVKPLSNERADFVRSGYRHSRSSLQVGFGSDQYHVVEKWGDPVQPYGEWRYPYRPYSVPYGAWGPQLPQVVGGNGLGVIATPWMGGGWNGVNPAAGNGNVVPNGAGVATPSGTVVPNGPWGGNFGYPPNGFMVPNQGQFGVGPGNALAPGQDDYYPQAPSLQAPYHSPLR